MVSALSLPLVWPAGLREKVKREDSEEKLEEMDSFVKEVSQLPDQMTQEKLNQLKDSNRWIVKRRSDGIQYGVGVLAAGIFVGGGMGLALGLMGGSYSLHNYLDDTRSKVEIVAEYMFSKQVNREEAFNHFMNNWDQEMPRRRRYFKPVQDIDIDIDID